MGLDMYLEKYPRYEDATANDVRAIESYLGWKDTENEKKYSLKKWCGAKKKDIHKDMVEFYKPYYIHRYSDWDTEHKYGYDCIMQQVGYWRKANAIHNWFVKNVQNGVDDCGSYIVSKYKLMELLNLCKKVQLKAISMVAPVKNGEQFKDGEWTPMYEEGLQIINADEIAKLLPTRSGFFFGGTDYDTYYLEDIKSTIEILERVLKETDFGKEAICYCSSW